MWVIARAAVVLALVGPVGAAEPGVEQAKAHLKTRYCTVDWDAADKIDPTAELEIGEGSGHGFTLGWLRFRPGQDSVEVLQVRYNAGRHPYRSKWPPDLAPVAVTRAQMKNEAYAELLAGIAAIRAVVLRPIEQQGIGGSRMWSSRDFWAAVRVVQQDQVLVNLEYAGYEASDQEIRYARPSAMVGLSLDAVKELAFEEHALTPADRAWASQKFLRDWPQITSAKFYWWVRERYLILIGVVGDDTVLSKLTEIVQGDAKKHDVYYAINAVTRLTGTDVREAPVEEMDIEKTRPRILEMLRQHQADAR